MKFRKTFIPVLVLSFLLGPLDGKNAMARQEDLLERIKSFLEKYPSSLNSKNPEGRTYLHWACGEGHLPSIKFLVEKGAEINIQDNNAQTPLHMLVQRNAREAVLYMLANGANADIQDNQKNTPLHLAVLAGARDAAAVLIEKGADVNRKDLYGRSSLHLCVISSDDPVLVRMLIDNGADLDSQDIYGASILDHATLFNRPGTVDILLQKGVTIPFKGERGRRLLISSVSTGIVHLFDRLKAGGADLSTTLKTGQTLFHLAAKGGSIDILESLFATGIGIDRKDMSGYTALHYAAREGHAEVARWLIAKGAAVNARNALGQTPVHVAREYERESVEKLLIRSGASEEDMHFPVIKGPYLGQTPPGDEPALFAPGIVSATWNIHSSIVFSPDGLEACWVPMIVSPGWGRFTIKRMTRERGQWTPPKQASFSTAQMDDVPFFSPDGKRLFFISNRSVEGGSGNPHKERIWYVDKTAEGWSDPRLLDEVINRQVMHWQFSLDREGHLYFGSSDPAGKGLSDIYCARFQNGRYTEPENLGAPINSEKDEFSPFIMPDGSALLFTRDGKLYISFRRNNEGWTEPENLGPKINAFNHQFCPVLSPDGKYLFYTAEPAGGEMQLIYWVSAGVIEKLKKKALG